MNSSAFESLITLKLMQSGSLVPACAQAALALLERVRETSDLSLEKHLSSAGQSLISHETYGDMAHKRFELDKINKNHGRRSSSIRDWGQDLLDLLASEGFPSMGRVAREGLIDAMQSQLASLLKGILDLEPFSVRIKGRSAEAVIREVLEQAEAKGRIGQVAQYLVGAKLQLRFPAKHETIGLFTSNQGDRKFRGDAQQRRGDFDLGEFVIEVAAGAPDAKHIDQVAAILEDADTEVWLIVRGDRHQFWKDEILRADIDHRRVVVATIELFVGQNITELGELSAKGKADQLVELFRIYNNVWIDAIGSPGMRIAVK